MSTSYKYKKNDKIFNFDGLDTDSQSQQKVQQMQHIQLSSNLNPQKSTLINNNDKFNPIEKNYSSVNIRQTQVIDLSQKKSINPHLRRNRSFKVKKQNQSVIIPNRQIYNKSISKYKNIFEDVDQQTFNSPNILAIHQQTKKQTNLQMYSSVKIDSKFIIQKQKQKQSSKQSDYFLKNYKKISNLLKLSTIIKQKQELMKENTDLKKKMMRTTNFTDKSTKQALQKRFGEKLALNKKIQQDYEKKVNIKIDLVKDLNIFAHKKISNSQVLVAKLKKNTSGLNFIWPQYHLTDYSTHIHILSAKKKSANTTSNYYISRSKTQIDVQNQQYMGKVRSNFIGSTFNIFSQGSNPQSPQKDRLKLKIRELLATVTYQTKMTHNIPKQMTLYMLKPPFTYYDLQGTSIKQQQSSLQQLYHSHPNNKQKISIFKNRKPIYNKKQKKFVLSFNNRVKKASTKNFILEDLQTKKEIMMLGKIQEDQYVVYISSPLTPHVGMGILVAEMDGKIVCD